MNEPVVVSNGRCSLVLKQAATFRARSHVKIRLMTSATADLRNSLSPDISKHQPSPNISNKRDFPQEPHCGELSRRPGFEIVSAATPCLAQVQTAVFVNPASAGSCYVSDSSCLRWFVRAREDYRSMCCALGRFTMVCARTQLSLMIQRWAFYGNYGGKLVTMASTRAIC